MGEITENIADTESAEEQAPTPRCNSCAIAMANGFIATLIAFSLAALSIYLYTRNNDFPYFYHPDEFKKGYQILDPNQPRSFAHPALMLEAANLVRDWFETPQELQETVVTGRWASAGMAAIGVMAFTLAGYRLYGFSGLLIAGMTMALCPPLLVHAHYFKEDATLIGGIGIATLGAVCAVTSKPRLWTQLLVVLLLAIGTAAAASGKYVGAVMALPALVALAIMPTKRWWHWPTRFVVFVPIAAAVFVGINIRAFVWDDEGFRISPAAMNNFEYEYEHGTQGHYNLALDIPNSYAFRMAMSDLMPHVWVFAAFGAAWVIYRHRFSRAGIVIPVILLVWVAALSRNAIPIPRYGLPISVLSFFIGAVLLAKIVFDLQEKRRAIGFGVLAACVALIVASQGSRCLNFNEQFRDDSRHRARQWVATNVPAGSRLAADNYTAFFDGGDTIRHPEQDDLSRFQIPRTTFAADAALSLEDLGNSGVEYVAVSGPSYLRFMDHQVHGWPEGSERQFDRRKQFYLELFEKGQVAYAAIPDPPTHSYVNPPITIYRIRHLATAPIAPPQPPRPRSIFDRFF